MAIIVACCLTPGIAAGQQQVNVSVDSGDENREPVRTVGGLDLLEIGVDGADGYAVFRNSGESPVDVTLYDAVITESGSPSQTEREIAPNQTVRIEVPTTASGDGRRAIGMLVGGSVYFEILDSSNQWFRGSPTWGETRIAALGGFAGGVAIVLLLARRELDSEQKEVQRIL
jgi:hypothetical protein